MTGHDGQKDAWYWDVCGGCVIVLVLLVLFAVLFLSRGVSSTQ